MNCPECLRLKAERELQQLRYTMAVSRLKLAALSSSAHDEYLRLSEAAQNARIDLNLVETQITQHQDRHAVAN